MRVLVCGGRDYDDAGHIWDTLDELNSTRGPISCIIHGAATGADTQAMLWTQLMDNMLADEPPLPGQRRSRVVHAPFLADWHTYGNAAGPIRNARMIKEGKPDVVVVFPGGRGTANCMAQAIAAGIEIIEVKSRVRAPV